MSEFAIEKIQPYCPKCESAIQKPDQRLTTGAVSVRCLSCDWMGLAVFYRRLQDPSA
jgi:hypothetical protein